MRNPKDDLIEFTKGFVWGIIFTLFMVLFCFFCFAMTKLIASFLP